MINVSNRRVSSRKITEKVDKSFCRGNFSLCPVENHFFGQGSEEMSKECARKVSRPCHFHTLSFFQKKVTQRWWTDIRIFFPEVFPSPPSLESLAVAMGLWHAHPIRWRFSCSGRKNMATCHSRLGVAQCTIGMSTSTSAGNPSSRQKLLWCHFSRSLSI